MDYFLTTARLGFRCWRADDLPLAMELWRDAQVTALIGGPFTAEEVRARLEQEIAQMLNRRVQYWPIFLFEGDEFAGRAGLRPWSLEPRIYELGFHLLPSHWGKGLAAEAARAAIDYGFSTLGAEVLFAGHHPRNDRSRRVLKKLGFVEAGEEFYEPSGVVEPVYLLHRK
jgi:ribosomal-protein-alanine N-acetyltransferase